MKPLMYGYLREACEAGDDEVERIERALKSFAGTAGFCYATTFYEYQLGSYAAFEELVVELKRAEAQYVVVPSFQHLSVHPMVCDHLLLRLASGVNAQVFELGSPRS